MKILQICNKAPFPANDGSSIAIYNMAKGLIENGADLTLLTINTKKHFKADEGVPSDFKKQCRYRSVYRNTDISFPGALLNLFSRQSYFVSRFYFSEFAKQLQALLKENNYDIVQLEGLFMGAYIPVIRKNSKARIVLRAHNIEHYIWRRHIAGERSKLRCWYLNLQNKRLTRFEQEVFHAVDAIVPITSTDEKGIRALCGHKPMFSCITGVDVNAYAGMAREKEKQDTVFYFGSMDWMPNQEAVLWFLEKCWDKIHRAVPSAKFVIAGRGIPLHFFKIIKPNLSIVEEIESSPAFFRQHQIMIVPLWSGSGLRIKIIEAMAYGKAIVSTSIGAEGINCTSGEHIIIANEADSFADAVIQLLSVQEFRKNIGKNAALFAGRHFDNKHVVKGLVNFYRSFVNV